MRIIIIENDYDEKRRLWSLLGLNHGSIVMDYVYGREQQSCIDSDDQGKEFAGVSVTLKEGMDAFKLSQTLEHFINFEGGQK